MSKQDLPMSLGDCCVDRKSFSNLKRMAQGGFGVVYSATDSTGKKVALKESKEDPEDIGCQISFMREVALLHEVRHPTTLPFRGFALPNEKERNFLLVTDWMQNGSLDDFIGSEEKELTPTQKSIAVFGMAVALRYLHSLHIVHRDFKPSNVFMDENMEPRVADFGLARIFNPNDVVSGRMGTPPYMAPEIFGRLEDVSFPVDVYAFAVSVAELLAGGLLTRHRDLGMVEFIQALLLGERYLIPTTAPRHYVQLVQVCWATDPDERPSFDQIVELLDHDEFCFPGTDTAKFNAYRKKVMNVSQAPPPEPERERPVPRFNWSDFE